MCVCVCLVALRLNKQRLEKGNSEYREIFFLPCLFASCDGLGAVYERCVCEEGIWEEAKEASDWAEGGNKKASRHMHACRRHE